MNNLEKSNFIKKKKILLEELKSSKTKYKRLALSPIRYAGGKSLAVGHIIEKIPPIKRLISPFFGGGSVEIALSQRLDVEIIACEINKALVNYWQYQIKYPKKLYDELLKLKPTKEEYQKIKNILKSWKKKEIRLNKLKLAAYFFFNHNLSYGPSFIGWPSNVYLNEKKYKKMLEKVKHFNANIKIFFYSFEKLFKLYSNDFFYCDPPYFLKEDDETSQMFAGIYPERNNPMFHTSFNHEKLRNLLKKHKGGFILSYNDCTKSRSFYEKYKFQKIKWQYTMGQGETRISQTLKNRNIAKKNSHIKKSHEILFFSSS